MSPARYSSSSASGSVEPGGVENAQLAGGKRTQTTELEAADPPAIVPAMDDLGGGDKRGSAPRGAAETYDGGGLRDYDGVIVYRLAARHGSLSVDRPVEGATVDGNGSRQITISGRLRAVGVALEHFVYRAHATGRNEDELSLTIDVAGQRFSSSIPATGSTPEWRPFDLSSVDPELIQQGIDRLRRARR